MDYFFRSFWLGALLQPKSLACALKRNPMMLTLVAAVLLFICDFVTMGYWALAVWLLGMIVFIITPRRHYILKSGNNELYVCLYDGCHTFDLDTEDEYRPVILRVFEKEGKKWQTLLPNVLIRGFDDTLTPSGFLLIKLSLKEWSILGNGHTVKCIHQRPASHCHLENFSFHILGEKLDRYVFYYAHKREQILNFISGQEVISFDIKVWEKCEEICLDPNNRRFEELKTKQGSFSSLNGLTAGKNGIFFLVEQEKESKLFKVVYKDGFVATYQVFVRWFSCVRKKRTCFFESSSTQGYLCLREKYV